MSMNYDLQLQRSIDILAARYSMKELRSDDPYILEIYSHDEEAAIEALRIYSERKGKYFDKQRNRLMPRCEFLMIEGHAVVDLIHVIPDPAKEIEREKYVENKRRSMRRHFP
ncbi:MAG: hypothetical protein RE472_00020 [Thermoplasmatales archaeon]|jgi:hypothetical protein|nr:MAG: hypothetical protein RE472_00020 [Thermoplasmatales archaeon]